jgi:putative alpha-1,2-mannosidase
MQGAFPRWMMASTEAGCMIGNSGSAIILEAIDAGFGKEFDVNVIQQALQKQSTQNVPMNGRADVDFYVANGYVSVEGTEKGASHTMTNAYDDWVLAGISEYTGATADAQAAYNRSTNYKNVFSSEHEFICPRSNTGAWMCVDEPQKYRYWENYVEGNIFYVMMLS